MGENPYRSSTRLQKRMEAGGDEFCLQRPSKRLKTEQFQRHDPQDAPIHEVDLDQLYRKQVLEELSTQFDNDDEGVPSYGERSSSVIHKILLKAKPPNLNRRRGPVEARFLSTSEASALLSSNHYDADVPIITPGQQNPHLPPYNPKEGNSQRPIERFFDWIEDLDRLVSVQVPSIRVTRDSYQRKKLIDIKNRLLDDKHHHGNKNQRNPTKNDRNAITSTEAPYNLLDFINPLPSCLPRFLQNINCQLLHRIRDSVLCGASAERTSARVAQWDEWRDILEWSLLAEGGSHTAPHTDSHGLETWISVQEGDFGFGWMARPSRAEREEWMRDPTESIAGDRWRFVVLRPGQTVFFGAGTVHFVFRIHGVQTLALGGHILRWNGIERWLGVLRNQLSFPAITNEDMNESVGRFVAAVDRLLRQRLKYGREVEVLGGLEGMKRVRGLVQEFEKSQNNAKKAGKKRNSKEGKA